MRPAVSIVAGLVLLAGAAGAPPSQPPVQAGTAVDLGVQGLVDGSGLVVEGRVVGARSFADGRGVILTEYDLHVERTFLGEEDEVRTVVLPGGVLEDGRGMLVAGMPQLAVGQRNILFLSDPAGPAAVRVPIGLSQGRVEVLDAPGGARLAVRSHSQLVVADPQTGRLSEPEALDVLDYGALIAEIRAAVAARESAAGSAAR